MSIRGSVVISLLPLAAPCPWGCGSGSLTQEVGVEGALQLGHLAGLFPPVGNGVGPGPAGPAWVRVWWARWSWSEGSGKLALGSREAEALSPLLSPAPRAEQEEDQKPEEVPASQETPSDRPRPREHIQGPCPQRVSVPLPLPHWVWPRALSGLGPLFLGLKELGRGVLTTEVAGGEDGVGFGLRRANWRQRGWGSGLRAGAGEDGAWTWPEAPGMERRGWPEPWSGGRRAGPSDQPLREGKVERVGWTG